MWNPFKKYIPLTKIVKDVSWQGFLLHFCSLVVHQACYFHSELLKYKPDPVTIRFESPMDLYWPGNEAWALCRTYKAPQGVARPAFTKSSPVALCAPPFCYHDCPEVSKAPGCSTPLGLRVLLFYLCEIFYFHAPLPVSQTTFTNPSRHSHSSSSKICMIFPSRIFHYILCFLPTSLLTNIIAFSPNTESLSLTIWILTIQIITIYMCKNICPQITMYLEPL